MELWGSNPENRLVKQKAESGYSSGGGGSGGGSDGTPINR